MFTILYYIFVLQCSLTNPPVAFGNSLQSDDKDYVTLLKEIKSEKILYAEQIKILNVLEWYFKLLDDLFLQYMVETSEIFVSFKQERDHYRYVSYNLNLSEVPVFQDLFSNFCTKISIMEATRRDYLQTLFDLFCTDKFKQMFDSVNKKMLASLLNIKNEAIKTRKREIENCFIGIGMYPVYEHQNNRHKKRCLFC